MVELNLVWEHAILACRFEHRVPVFSNLDEQPRFTMNRRDFLIRSSAASLGLLAQRSLLAQIPTGAPAAKAEFKTLRRNVGTFTMRGGTIGWLASPDALVAVDTQFPDTAAHCLAGLPGRGARTLDVVINTHHHGDHTGGNRVFKDAAKSLVAHANVPALQRSRAERDGTLDRQVYADATFADTWRLDVGDEVVSAKYHGPGHTKGDITVHFEKANVVHMGDLMFNRIYPAIDRPGGASIRHWMTILDQQSRAYDKDTLFIFGHGNAEFGATGRREDLSVFRDYLGGLLAHVEREIAAGKTKEEIMKLENLPGFPQFHQKPPHRLGTNLAVAYDELTTAKG